ncbi:MAG: hypothetical protein M1820_002314 [Bogoriella megaspora]|nr:MAG: hypothetical protein M1820_002314 [Bogoriella megaspora]
MAKLIEYMHDTGFHQFPKQGEDSPFTYTWKTSLWEYLEQHPEHKKWFADYMAIRYQGVDPWFVTFPMSETLAKNAKRDAESVLLVDVGGSSGHELIKFHQSHPDAPGRLVVQDLPTVIEKHQTEETPRYLEMMAYDFFTPQPIKGARAYFFQNIAHDWPDAECRTILINTVRAMSKGYSRILIKDYVLPDIGVGLRASTLDIIMMCACSGIERTQRQWSELLDSCGLKIVKVWQTRSDYEQVIEATLKNDLC